MKPVEKGEPYRCEGCGGVFTARNDPQESLAEAEIVFGREIPECDRAVVCDECWPKFLKWYEKIRHSKGGL